MGTHVNGHKRHKDKQNNHTKSEERVWPADLIFIIHSEVEITHKYQTLYTCHQGAIEMLQAIVIT